ncbi:translation initiation factor IF-2 [Candidatus Woesearchaeota archaeon]|nr:translation initiation factor IF-2 [Candidatus Woesearchaeota archaeon]
MSMEEKTLRQVQVAILGHVDHGKTKLLDKIRGTAVQTGEAGGITQAIGASIIPLKTIKIISGKLMQDKRFTIPGLLFIDTPGHAAFTNLRKRGGSLADIAILVVDINEGFKPQTIESLEILKGFKTPFVVAANKIDLIPGFKKKEKPLLQSIKEQDPYYQEKIETKLYEIVGKLSEYGFPSERFDRVEDYTKQIAIIPTSAITGDGIPELLMVLIGLAQKYLEKNIHLNAKGPAKGSVLEVKESKGLGTTMDVILYDGSLKVGEEILIGGINGSIRTKVRALLEPAELCEIRDKKSRFCRVDKVRAATGVKISAPDIDEVIAGMPVRSFTKDTYEKTKAEIDQEVKDALIETGKDGIIIKADTLGSLEALTMLLKEKEISVRKATIGDISKKDMIDAETNYEKDPLKSVILGFNVNREEGVSSTEKVKIITNDIIYRIIEEYEQWKTQTREILEAKKLDELTRPAQIQLLKQYIFRQSNPAIIGAEVLEGKIKPGTRLMKKNKPIASIKSIQEEQESIQSATKGKQAAFALQGVTIGRQIQGDEILYSYIPENDFRKLKKYAKYLTKAEIELLKQIASFMREENPVWGV